MQVSNVTNEDGINCAVLINALMKARFSDVSGKDMEAVHSASKWLHGIAQQMAAQLSPSKARAEIPAPSESTGFRVKNMGPIGSKKTKKK